jgi:hypothetical protein
MAPAGIGYARGGAIPPDLAPASRGEVMEGEVMEGEVMGGEVMEERP